MGILSRRRVAVVGAVLGVFSLLPVLNFTLWLPPQPIDTPANPTRPSALQHRLPSPAPEEPNTLQPRTASPTSYESFGMGEIIQEAVKLKGAILRPVCEADDPAARKGPMGREPTPCYSVAPPHPPPQNLPPCTAPPTGSRPEQNKEVAAAHRRKVENMVRSKAGRESLLHEIREQCAWDVGTEWKMSDTLRKEGLYSEAHRCSHTSAVDDITHYPSYPLFDDLPHPTLDTTPRAVHTIPATKYWRRAKGGWFVAENVCLTCESGPRDPWMDYRRDCHTTLWALKSEEPRLAAKHRKGRHSIYAERQAAFQYRGLWKGSGEVRWAKGTTVYLASYSQPNIGHALHDAYFSYHSAIASLDEVNATLHPLPYPVQAVIEHDFFRNSIRYFSVLTMLVSLFELRRTPRLLDYGQGPVCFEAVVFPGADRSLLGTGVPKGGRFSVTKRLQLAVGAFIPPPQPHPRLRVFMYGRGDVHRRSIDNFNAFVEHTKRAVGSAGEVVVIRTMYGHPLAQAELFRKIDVLLTVQGAHMQNSIFMPDRASIIELSPCHAKSTSFLFRYGCFRPQHRHIIQQICFPSANLGPDKYSQNLTLCPHHMDIASQHVLSELRRISLPPKSE